MSLDCSINGIDHVERATRGSAVLDVPGSYVKRKELGGESALLHASDVCAIGNRRRAAKIEIVVGHRCRDVVMGVDDDRAPVNLERSLPESFVASLSRSGGYDRQTESNQTKQVSQFHELPFQSLEPQMTRITRMIRLSVSSVANFSTSVAHHVVTCVVTALLSAVMSILIAEDN